MHSDPSGGQTGFRYLPDPLGRLNQGCYLRQRDLPDPFGRLTAEPKPEPEISNFRNPFRIRDSVGMEGMNSRRDVAKVESLLGRAGALDLAETDGVTGFFGARADEAVKKFQKDHGLRVDGLINPNGPTLRTLIAGAGQRGNNAGLPGRTPGIVAKQENPLPPFSEQPTPDPRRETIKRIAGRFLEIQKAGTGTEIAQGPVLPTKPVPPTSPKTSPPKDPVSPAPPKTPKVPGAPFTPEEQRKFEQLREVTPGITKEQVERLAREGRVTKEQLLKVLREQRIQELQQLLDILK